MDRATSQFLRYRQAGDLAALGCVFDLLAPRLLSLALHLCRHAADAEDVVQATFVVAMQKPQQFEPGRDVAPWLAGILAGEARNLARRRQRRDADALGDVADAAAAPGELAERRELVQQLRTHIAALPDEQRQALLLQLEHGLQPAEIGEVLGVPAGTVRVRVHRGLRALRKLLPASLATLLLGQLAPRGLAAVKQAVLQQAQPVATGCAATGLGMAIGGVLVMKQVMAAVALVVLGFAGWWAMTPTAPSPSALGKAPEAPPALAAAATASAPQGDRTALSAAEPIERRQLPDTGSLRVEVQWDGDGGPVADVAIAIWPQVAAELRPPQPLGAARTGADGIAVFADLPAATVVVDMQPDGNPAVFGKKPLCASIPRGGQAVLTRQLPLLDRLRGRTVDDVGAPVADAALFASTNSSASAGIGVETTTAEPSAEAWRLAAHSRADGSFELPLAKGEYILGASSRDHAAAGTQRIRDAAAGIVLILARDHCIVTGTVIDGTGGAIDGAWVRVRAADPRDQRLADGTEVSAYAPMLTRAAADGTFTLPGLCLGEHVLRVEAAGFAPWTQRLTLSTGGTQPLTIALQRQATIAVTVRDADGVPVPGATVAVWCGDLEARYPTHEFKTGAEGCGKIDQLPAGDVRVQATQFGTGRAAVTFTLREGEARACELRLAPRVGIRGRLVDGDGAPIAGGAITATDETWNMGAFRDRPQAPFGTRTEDDGSFELRDLGPYPFRLQVLAPNGKDLILLAEHVEPEAGVRTFVLPSHQSAATVTGVVLGPDGLPCASARVAPWRKGDSSTRGALTDAQGRFALTPLDPGTYTVQVSSEGLLGCTTEPFELAIDEHRDVGTLRLRLGARLAVRALDGAGQPWRAAAPTILFWSEDQKVHNGNWRDRQTIVFGPLPRCRGRAAVHMDNLVAWPAEVQLLDDQETAIDLRVQVGTMRRLRFQRAPQKEVSTLRVRVTDAEGRELLSDRVAWPADQGAVETRVALLPGHWTVAADDDVGGRFAGSLDVLDLGADDSPQTIAPAK